jgi:hypothetical protein
VALGASANIGLEGAFRHRVLVVVGSECAQTLAP